MSQAIAEPHSSVGSIADLRTGGSWFNPAGRPIFFRRIHDSHCDRIRSSLMAVHCFDNGYSGKQSVALKEYCAEYWLKEIQESMGRCTGCYDIQVTGILLKTMVNTIQSITKSQTIRWLILGSRTRKEVYTWWCSNGFWTIMSVMLKKKKPISMAIIQNRRWNGLNQFAMLLWIPGMC